MKSPRSSAQNAGPNSFPELRLDWCSYRAAKYAVEHWHYSRVMPVGKVVTIGVWECGRFVGALVFGLGGGNTTNGKRFGLARVHEVAELCRVALADNHKSQVSRIVRIGLIMLHYQSPGLRLIISLADPAHNHIGAIYQAGNWFYTGQTTPTDCWKLSDGKMKHRRWITTKGAWARPFVTVLRDEIASGKAHKITLPPKHRYLMPLDDEMRKRLAPLARPYPKRVRSETVDTPAVQAGEGGSTPTRTLQITGHDATGNSVRYNPVDGRSNRNSRKAGEA